MSARKTTKKRTHNNPFEILQDADSASEYESNSEEPITPIPVNAQRYKQVYEAAVPMHYLTGFNPLHERSLTEGREFSQLRLRTRHLTT